MRVAIDLAIYVRIVFSGIIQTLIIVDDGMEAKRIRNFGPEARRTKTSSSCGSHELMVLHWRWTPQDCQDLPLIVAMMPIMRQGADMIMIDATVMEVVEAVEVGKAGEAMRAAAVSISIKTKVRPLSPVSSHT